MDKTGGSCRECGKRTTNNYFKVTYSVWDIEGKQRILSAFFFFDDADPAGRDEAFAKAGESIAAMSVLEGAESARLTVFRRLETHEAIAEVGECKQGLFPSELS